MLFSAAWSRATPAAGCRPDFMPEIQGLRAVSVLAVVGAHAGVPGLPGGFAGVDVFFVISGFLVTRLLLAEMARTGRVGILDFWARRARRLLPNAFAALIGTVLLATFIFPGYYTATLAREVMFAALELANFHFANLSVDYFNADLPRSPVLHFWSLSIEEQFYIVLPLILFAIAMLPPAHVRKAVTSVFAAICLASFAWCVSLSDHDPAHAYFNTGSRVWQLGVGALLAARWSSIQALPAPVRRAAAWLGAGGILAALLLLDGVRYPGWWALLPTLSAAALIAGIQARRESDMLRRALAAPAMQWIGARSYSWYLWHWPLLVLPRIAYPDAPFVEPIAVAASLLVAMAAYRWIELPFRRGGTRQTVGAWPTLGGAFAALAVVVAVGAAAPALLAAAYPVTAARMAAVKAARADMPSPARDGCHISGSTDDQPGSCLYGDVSGQRRAVLFGDSHAFHWFEPIDIAARDSGWQLQSWTKSACPSADVSIDYRGFYESCDRWREAALRRLTGPDRPDLVILSSNTRDTGRVADRDTRRPVTEAEGERLWADGLARTVRRLLAAGVEVAIIRNTPGLDAQARSCLTSGRQDCRITRAKGLRGSAVDAIVARSFGDRITFLDFTDSICGPDHCDAVQGGLMVFRDAQHLTASYAATHAPAMRGLLAAAERKPKKASGTTHSLLERGDSPAAKLQR